MVEKGIFVVRIRLFVKHLVYYCTSLVRFRRRREPAIGKEGEGKKSTTEELLSQSHHDTPFNFMNRNVVYGYRLSLLIDGSKERANSSRE